MSPTQSPLTVLRDATVLSVLVMAAAVGCAPPPSPAASADPGAADTDRAKRVHAMALDYEARLPAVPQIEAGGLIEKNGATSRSIVYVDCRTPRERAVSTLPGAVTPQELGADPERYAGTDWVVYCTIGYRSSKLVERMRRQGFNATNLRGGVLAWAHAGGEFVTPEGEPTNRVHIYGRPWDLLPSGYEAKR